MPTRKIKAHEGTETLLTCPKPYARKSPTIPATPLKQYYIGRVRTSCLGVEKRRLTHVRWRTGCSCKRHQKGVISPRPGLQATWSALFVATWETRPRYAGLQGTENYAIHESAAERSARSCAPALCETGWRHANSLWNGRT